MNNVFRRALSRGTCLLLLTPLIVGPARAESDSAVLIMSGGGNSQWTKSITKAVKDAQLPYPHRIFFGTGDTQSEQHDLQDAISDLEDKGAHTIYVVPLVVSSYSETARQWKYLLGLDVQAGFMNVPLFPIQKHSTIRFGEPLDDSVVVVEILLDRAREISTDPEKEAIFIISNGPNDNTDNDRWNQILGNVAARLKERGGFKSAEGIAFRDDAPPSVRDQAIQNLRDRVKAADQAGARALVVSMFLAPGGIEHKIGLELRGYNYAFNTKSLLPDSRISEWIRSQIP